MTENFICDKGNGREGTSLFNRWKWKVLDIIKEGATI